ncbi:MAG: hypothetical protein FWH03_02460 [Firmicutes bacterium]|nr:hypothetical protein [Bacillota bacterium]
MKDPYVIIGVSKDADEQELTLRYNYLRNQYAEARFLPGEQGNEAAQKLSELEDAWMQIQSDLAKKQAETQFGGDFGHIDALIRGGSYDEAQRLLDAMSTRPAEWHYLQSIIFYKKEWMADSKAQLEMAVSQDPYNQKYRVALDRMKMIDGNPRIDPTTLGGGGPIPQGQPRRSPTCGECCMAYLCADCLCGMGRGCC